MHNPSGTLKPRLGIRSVVVIITLIKLAQSLSAVWNHLFGLFFIVLFWLLALGGIRVSKGVIVCWDNFGMVSDQFTFSPLKILKITLIPMI